MSHKALKFLEIYKYPVCAEHEMGPYGCRCKTLSERVTGDGCDICNPEKAKQYERDEASE